MRTPLAWHNLKHRRARTLVALSGVSFAILLIFMQLGFYGSCKTSATMIHELMEFDLLLTSRKYVFLLEAGNFPRRRLYQAESVDGAASVVPIRVASEQWRNPQSRNRYAVLVIGVDPVDRPFVLEELNDAVPSLRRAETAMMDAEAHPVLGNNSPGTVTQIGDRRIEVIGRYPWGAGFVSNAAVIVSDQTFVRIFPQLSMGSVQLALVRLRPGADPSAVSERLAATLPADTRVWTRAEIERRDQDFYMRERPLGLIFTSGVILALLVGAVILFQVLSSEVTNHLKEFATLKALGYTSTQAYGVVMQQGFLYALVGFLPACILAWGLYALLRSTAKLPVMMSAEMIGMVLALSVAMCSAAGLLAIRRVNAADPADLF